MNLITECEIFNVYDPRSRRYIYIQFSDPRSRRFICIFIYIFNFQILDHADKWGVDMFRIAEITDNKTLTCVTYTIFQVNRRHLFLKFT